MSTNEMSPKLAEAFKKYQAGDHLGAENSLISAVQSAQSQHGTSSVEYATANYELGSMLNLMGRHADAAKALTKAVDVNIPDDHQATRDRLTYMMQLGELYDQMGELPNAEMVLRKGLRLREDFYTNSHPGYAFGLEPLASVMMNQGNFDEALQLVDETIDNFWMNGHPRVATAFPLRAMILKKMNDSRPTFEGIEELPDQILSDMVDGAVALASPSNAVHAQAVMDELLVVVEKRFGARHDAVVKLRTVLVNNARSIGPSEGQLETTEKIVEAHLANGKVTNAIQAMLGLALTQGSTGDSAGSEKTYKQAFKKSKEIGDLLLQSQCLRNLGLLYSELKRKPEAEKTLRLAAQAGQQSKDSEMFGRSLVALGIFVQHEGNLDEAKKLLTHAMKLLPPSHPDGLCGRSHLNAIENNASCGCGDMGDAICEAYRLHLLKMIPNGFVNDVSVALGEEGFAVTLDNARELNEEETDQLHRAIQQAHIDFQKQMKERT